MRPTVLLAVLLPAASAAAAPASTLVDVRGGAYVPFFDLRTSGLVGVDVMHHLGRRLVVGGGFDWSYLTQQGSSIVSPPEYPKSRTDLTQSSNMGAVHVDVQLQPFRLGPLDPYVGIGGGVAWTATKFDAYGMPSNQASARPIGQVSAGVRGKLGAHLRWVVDLTWRATGAFDLGGPGGSGETRTSGFAASAGAGWAF